eukprot:m.83551 g.83551  ORF g.83551 m.83551 type:complete len:992 (+) comp14769_c0_seq3:504-3479(+)
MPLKRGNSMIRGSGHSLTGNKPRKGSIVRTRRSGSFRRNDGTAVYDLVLLTDVSENGVVDNITNMYSEDMIYSYIGNVVIAVNPFADLKIYNQEHIDKYRGRSAFDPKLPPHIFALADNVFSDLRYRGSDQVVIISGESGSGKTESSKKIMQYVAAVSGSTGKVDEVKSRLLATNPVLEAFGNAKTVRNDNSSRFGKYMDIQFDFHGEPAGGFITTYLLEKGRVIRQAENERNFHIFYQLLASGEAQKLGLSSDPNEYHYLKQGGSPTVSGMNDSAWFKEMQEGLNFVGFPSDAQAGMFQILAAIILLGEVEFKDAGNNTSKVAKQPPKLAELLGATAAEVENALTHNTVIVNRQQMASDLDAAQAVVSRDALAKAMYEKLFQYVYTLINKNCSAETEKVKAVIGVLDIYGFEILQNNSFEQFCINYCNEKLQQLFIELTLKSEQEEYLNEGIEWTPVEFFNNKIICDLVEDRTNGIIALLDEESIRPGDTSDRLFLEKMAKTFVSHDHFQTRSGPQDKSLPEGVFRVVHYAGTVDYVVNGFLEKNTDTLFKDLSRLMFSSKNAILKEMFPEGDESNWAGAAKRPPTAGKAFVSSMNHMIAVLNTKIPSYVRCIKPNHNKAARQMDDQLLRHQVQYLGLVENVRVRRAGFCFREPVKTFFWRYKMLSPKTWPNWKGSDADGCKEVFEALAIMPTAYQMGKTKVFIKNPLTVFKLEEERDERLEEIVQRLQLAYRLYRIRKEIHAYYEKLKTAFKDVKTDTRYGKGVEWPEHGKVLDQADEFLKRVYRNWWARKMILSLSAEEQASWRVQLLSHGFFAGKKEGFALKGAVYSTHYASNQDGLARSVGASLFDSEILKISHKGKPMSRVLVLTKHSIMKLDAGLSVKPSRTFPLKDISHVTVSKHPDPFIVVHSKAEGNDFILCVEKGGANHVHEFASRLYIACRDVENKISVKIADSIEYNSSKKPGATKTLTFSKNPAGTGSEWQNGSVLY